jgi:hypothetical protein
MRLLRRHRIRKETRLKEDENSTNRKRRATKENQKILLKIRRMIWELIVWPLILENDRAFFAVEEYKVKVDELCEVYEMQVLKLSGFLIALVAKGLLIKRGDAYWIHSRHMLYMQKKISLGYGRAVKEVYNIK